MKPTTRRGTISLDALLAGTVTFLITIGAYVVYIRWAASFGSGFHIAFDCLP